MEVVVENWPIKKLLTLKNDINPQPIYQRKEVWKGKKQRFLIDSILRGIDIPKFYFRELNNGLFKYEVADGQQRLNAIFDFVYNDLKLTASTLNGFDLSKINDIEIEGQGYSTLKKDHPGLFKHFNNYKLTVSVVKNATNDEIRSLFGRLQMGNSLVPAEIRNAINSRIGVLINNLALNHKFFEFSKIPPFRYKHHDYLAHVLALIHFTNGQDLKANDLLALYNDFINKRVPQKYESICDSILDNMLKIDRYSKKRIINKWAFVDIFNFLYKNINKKVNHKSFALEFDKLEKKRIKFKSEQEKLLLKKSISKYDRSLYNYIVAFNTEGNTAINIEKRYKTFVIVFNKHLTN